MQSKLFVKFVRNNKLNTVRVLCAYNVYKNAEGKYVFPAQKQCAYVSGDLRDEDVANTLVRIGNKMDATLALT